ncbi:MAG TPA: DNA polymerase III subunit beta, partial [Methylobacterium sp.]
LPVEDFPSIAAGTFTVEMDLSPKIFRRMSDEVAFAISTEETRYYLNGIYLHAPSLDSTAQLTAVATDGHRLSRSILCPYEAEAAMPGVIVPRKTVSQFGMIADAVDEDQTIRVSVSESKIAFEAGDLKLVSKLIDGTFPDYNRVIPANNPKLYCIDRAGLAGTVDRVQTISNERGRAAKFAFTADEVEVSVRSPDAGEAREALALEAEGPGTEDAMEIGFNAKYALDILSTLKGATVAFAMADPGSPSVISDPDDATRLVVLMPMRV